MKRIKKEIEQEETEDKRRNIIIKDLEVREGKKKKTVQKVLQETPTEVEIEEV